MAVPSNVVPSVKLYFGYRAPCTSFAFAAMAIAAPAVNVAPFTGVVRLTDGGVVVVCRYGRATIEGLELLEEPAVITFGAISASRLLPLRLVKSAHVRKTSLPARKSYKACLYKLLRVRKEIRHKGIFITVHRVGQSMCPMDICQPSNGRLTSWPSVLDQLTHFPPFCVSFR